MAILVFTWYKIGRLVGCGVKHLQFSYFLRIALNFRLSVFCILCYIDLFTRLSFPPHYYFVGSSTIQRYKLTRLPFNPDWVIINIILLLFLASCLLIPRWIRAPSCYNLIIWYKGGIKNGLIKMDTYNYLVKIGIFLIGEVYWEGGFNNTILGGILQYLVKLGIFFKILRTIVLCNKFTEWTTCIWNM